MQTASRTLIGVFSDLTDAKRATDELRALGMSQVRLVENDQDVTFTGTAERQGASSSESYSSDLEPRKSGIGAFFARLFGFDDDKDRSTWSLNRDSEAYFQAAYDRKHHLVIVEDFSDPAVCREVMNRFGGEVEDQGSRYYETERYRDRDFASSEYLADSSSERVMELREEQLDVHTERMQTGEVSLRKEIITETRTVEVPVTREEIVVERRPLDGVAHEGSLEAADMDRQEIRIPVSEEFVHIDKKVVPREEIRVSKERITDTKKVSEDLRREEAQVDSDGKVSIKDRRDSPRAPLSSTRGNDTIQPGI